MRVNSADMEQCLSMIRDVGYIHGRVIQVEQLRLAVHVVSRLCRGPQILIAYLHTSTILRCLQYG